MDWLGGCFCGAVRYRARAIFDAGYCHCSICRRISGAAAACWFSVREEDFDVLQGEPSMLQSSEHFARYFCARCGTHLFGRDDLPAPASVGSRLVSAMLGTLDTPDQVAPRLHQWWSSRVSWYERSSSLPTFDTGTIPHPDKRRVVTLRRMTEQDLGMLHEWLNRPHIVEWWGGERLSLEEVRKHYRPRVLAEHKVTPYIGLLDGRPFAYAQSYVALGSGDGWWEDETDPGVRGIDQSIADPELLGKGYGTQLVRALVDLLFTDPQVSKVQTDPAPLNLRAIRCYEKAGFRQIKTIATPDGPAVYMLHERPLPASAG